MTVHKRTHSDVRAFPCDECPKAFHYSHHLQLHKKSHSGLREHVCTYCAQGTPTPLTPFAIPSTLLHLPHSGWNSPLSLPCSTSCIVQCTTPDKVVVAVVVKRKVPFNPDVPFSYGPVDWSELLSPLGCSEVSSPLSQHLHKSQVCPLCCRRWWKGF